MAKPTQPRDVKCRAIDRFQSSRAEEAHRARKRAEQRLRQPGDNALACASVRLYARQHRRAPCSC